ncbi:MAG: AAA domain-containing protein [Desulfobacula sp.]|jgi:endopeptidase Clp ATP-binding regulatory subunit ClpX|uniref:AAA family ATPase n=2 Tax=Desulfobacula sp. TaxID=2593537 RepID=UPI001DB8F543|nr:AAA domain-containing protein [Desulfobacula sp.]MBT3487786.1 AAA domain-containing protein [Desulfobacula sp.]MBT3807486.1 AAA domain-containing protein [Desulfobacula sp.]MBT4506892.1 AAA domain-containing protein [Desulfobacula sp.]MBT5971746.1 AAA domain-containing protein [Desulfobacula sp.]
MKKEKNTISHDPKKIEKELGEFLNKKFGANVKIISPSTLPRQETISGTSSSEKNKPLIDFNIKPRELITYLDQYVVKQTKAKSVLSTKICTHFNRIRHSQANENGLSKITGNIKSNILMLGPTGIGKTYLIKLIAKKIGVPFVKADATKFSETGYVGGDVEDLIRDLVKEANDDIKLAECGIVYIDEIDKIASSPSVIGAQVSRTGVQRALLKPMEETEVNLKVPHDPVSMMQELESFQRTGKRTKQVVNTSNILFIVSGAFSELSNVIRKRLSKQNIGFGSKIVKSKKENELLKLTKAEDLVNFGFESEFIGRLPVRCILETLNQEDLYAILKMPNNPVILSKRLDFSAYNIDIIFTDEALKILAKRAYEENTGARGLVSVIEEALLDFEENLPSHDLLKFTVTKEVLENPKAHLKDLLSKQKFLKFNDLYEKALLDHKNYISKYINNNSKTLSVRHGLTLSQIRCDMIALYFCNNVMEIEDALKKIKNHQDSIKEIEIEVLKTYNLNIIFEEDAIDFLIEQFINHNATIQEILSKIYDNYYDGFNLIREKTGKDRFFLSKNALIDNETYLNDLIRKEIT